MAIFRTGLNINDTITSIKSYNADTDKIIWMKVKNQVLAILHPLHN